MSISDYILEFCAKNVEFWRNASPEQCPEAPNPQGLTVHSE
jgi:hypothetical protein